MAEANETRQAREEFQEARRALVDKYCADNPGLHHKDFDDVAIADLDGRAAELVTERASADREAAARFMGMTEAEFDTFEAERQKSGDGSQDAGQSTPQSRTASLPAGKPPTIPPPTQKVSVEGEGERAPLHGVDLIEDAAKEFITSDKFQSWLARGGG